MHELPFYMVIVCFVCVFVPVLVVCGFSLLAGSEQLSLPPRPGSWHINLPFQLLVDSQCLYSSEAELPDSGFSGLYPQSDAAPAQGHSRTWTTWSQMYCRHRHRHRHCLFLFVVKHNVILYHLKNRNYAMIWTRKMSSCHYLLPLL